MADIPEKKRTTGITPSQAVTGHQSAYSKLGEARFGAMGRIGMQIAQNAAIEQATINAVKAGQTPGQKLFPTLTMADKAYKEAYQKEEYNTVARQGESYLNNMYFDVAKNPTPQNVQQFEQNAKPQLDSLSNLVSEENRPKIRRDLESAFESKFLQLSGAMEDRNKKLAKQSLSASAQASSKQRAEYYATGETDKAQNRYDETREYFKSQRELGVIETDEELQQWLDTVEIEEEQYKEDAKALEAAKEGRASEYLAERADLPQTPLNLAATESAMKKIQFYNQLIGTQSHISKMNGLAEAEAGTLSAEKQLTYTQMMTERDRADFDNHVAKINLSALTSARDVQFTLDNRGNDIAMSIQKPEQLERAFQNEVANRAQLSGNAPTFEDFAQVASEFSAPIPSFTKQLAAMVNSSDPNKAVQGASVYSALVDKFPRSVDGIDSVTAAKADSLSSKVHAGQTPDEAFLSVNENIKGLTSSDIEHRKSAFKEAVSLKSLNRPTTQQSFIAEKMGYKKEMIPSGLYNDYMKNLQDAFVITNDWNQSNDIAKRNIDRVYQKTRINGDEQVMWMAPAAAIQGVGSNDIYMRNLVIRRSEELFKGQKKLFDTDGSGSVSHFEFEEGSIRAEHKVTEESRIAGKGEAIQRKQAEKKGKSVSEEQLRAHYSSDEYAPILINKVDSSGNKIKGKLIIQSDDVTNLPNKGESCSYGMYFLPDGKMIPQAIYSDKNQGNMARFSVTEADINEFTSVREQKKQAEISSAMHRNEVNKTLNEAMQRFGGHSDELL